MIDTVLCLTVKCLRFNCIFVVNGPSILEDEDLLLVPSLSHITPITPSPTPSTLSSQGTTSPVTYSTSHKDEPIPTVMDLPKFSFTMEFPAGIIEEGRGKDWTIEDESFENYLAPLLKNFTTSYLEVNDTFERSLNDVIAGYNVDYEIDGLDDESQNNTNKRDIDDGVSDPTSGYSSDTLHSLYGIELSLLSKRKVVPIPSSPFSKDSEFFQLIFEGKAVYAPNTPSYDIIFTSHALYRAFKGAGSILVESKDNGAGGVYTFQNLRFLDFIQSSNYTAGYRTIRQVAGIAIFIEGVGEFYGKDEEYKSEEEPAVITGTTTTNNTTMYEIPISVPIPSDLDEENPEDQSIDSSSASTLFSANSIQEVTTNNNKGPKSIFTRPVLIATTVCGAVLLIGSVILLTSYQRIRQKERAVALSDSDSDTTSPRIHVIHDKNSMTSSVTMTVATGNNFPNQTGEDPPKGSQAVCCTCFPTMFRRRRDRKKYLADAAEDSYSENEERSSDDNDSFYDALQRSRIDLPIPEEDEEDLEAANSLPSEEQSHPADRGISFNKFNEADDEPDLNATPRKLMSKRISWEDDRAERVKSPDLSSSIRTSGTNGTTGTSETPIFANHVKADTDSPASSAKRMIQVNDMFVPVSTLPQHQLFPNNISTADDRGVESPRSREARKKGNFMMDVDDHSSVHSKPSSEFDDGRPFSVESTSGGMDVSAEQSIKRSFNDSHTFYTGTTATGSSEVNNNEDLRVISDVLKELKKASRFLSERMPAPIGFDNNKDVDITSIDTDSKLSSTIGSRTDIDDMKSTIKTVSTVPKQYNQQNEKNQYESHHKPPILPRYVEKSTEAQRPPNQINFEGEYDTNNQGESVVSSLGNPAGSLFTWNTTKDTQLASPKRIVPPESIKVKLRSDSENAPQKQGANSSAFITKKNSQGDEEVLYTEVHSPRHESIGDSHIGSNPEFGLDSLPTVNATSLIFNTAGAQIINWNDNESSEDDSSTEEHSSNLQSSSSQKSSSTEGHDPLLFNGRNKKDYLLKEQDGGKNDAIPLLGGDDTSTDSSVNEGEQNDKRNLVRVEDFGGSDDESDTYDDEEELRHEQRTQVSNTSKFLDKELSEFFHDRQNQTNGAKISGENSNYEEEIEEPTFDDIPRKKKGNFLGKANSMTIFGKNKNNKNPRERQSAASDPKYQPSLSQPYGLTKSKSEYSASFSVNTDGEIIDREKGAGKGEQPSQTHEYQYHEQRNSAARIVSPAGSTHLENDGSSIHSGSMQQFKHLTSKMKKMSLNKVQRSIPTSQEQPKEEHENQRVDTDAKDESFKKAKQLIPFFQKIHPGGPSLVSRPPLPQNNSMGKMRSNNNAPNDRNNFSPPSTNRGYDSFEKAPFEADLSSIQAQGSVNSIQTPPYMPNSEDEGSNYRQRQSSMYSTPVKNQRQSQLKPGASPASSALSSQSSGTGFVERQIHSFYENTKNDLRKSNQYPPQSQSNNMRNPPFPSSQNRVVNNNDTNRIGITPANYNNGSRSPSPYRNNSERNYYQGQYDSNNIVVSESSSDSDYKDEEEAYMGDQKNNDSFPSSPGESRAPSKTQVTDNRSKRYTAAAGTLIGNMRGRISPGSSSYASSSSSNQPHYNRDYQQQQHNYQSQQNKPYRYQRDRNNAVETEDRNYRNNSGGGQPRQQQQQQQSYRPQYQHHQYERETNSEGDNNVSSRGYSSDSGYSQPQHYHHQKQQQHQYQYQKQKPPAPVSYNNNTRAGVDSGKYQQQYQQKLPRQNHYQQGRMDNDNNTNTRSKVSTPVSYNSGNGGDEPSINSGRSRSAKDIISMFERKR